MSRIIDAVKLVETLRGANGCPWDRAQTLGSMKNDLIEETYELVEALNKMDKNNIREELGDLLLHVLLHSQIAKEDGLFDIEEVAGELCEKLVRRHPHVFGDETATSKEAVLSRWEEIKRQEKKDTPIRFLDKANGALPPLEKAHKLQNRAAKAGFDWAELEGVVNKAEEEFAELRTALASGAVAHIKEELGDLIFVLVNLARRLGFTAGEALSLTNEKFVQRFNYIEDVLKSRGLELREAGVEEMEKLWQEAKGKGR